MLSSNRKGKPAAATGKNGEEIPVAAAPLQENNSNSSSSSHSAYCGFQNTEELQRVFKTFDANGDGKISSAELGNIMQSFGYQASREELCAMVEVVDSDGDGFISFDEFVELNNINGKGKGGRSGYDDLKEAFKMFDADKSGTISARELHKVLKSLGDKSTMEDCTRMIKSVDRDGDGLVNFEEFKSMMRNNKSSSSSRSCKALP
uniref:TSA: Wollemia nobilis Ref_Wollemi_Transcript_13419_1010 transcribed RNA sequence n=1 Tax=Wollemia nobilis TaxID=56998 RepID=A0A0C9S7J4_9CONI